MQEYKHAKKKKIYVTKSNMKHKLLLNTNKSTHGHINSKSDAKLIAKRNNKRKAEKRKKKIINKKNHIHKVVK